MTVLDRGVVRRTLPWVWTGSILLSALPVTLSAGHRGLLDPQIVLQVVFALGYAVLGLVIATQQPGNGVAWILLVVSTGIVFNGASAVTLYEPSSSESVWRVLAIVWSNGGYFIAFIIPLILLLYVFPTGHFLMPRWSWAGWVAAIASATVVFAEGFASEVALDGETATIPNPLGFHTIGGTDDGLVGLVLGVCLLALTAAGPIAMVVRYRRSPRVVRLQIKLVLVAMAFIPLLLLTGTLMSDSWVNTVAFLGAVTAVPIAITVAIVRHNLFDIDVVVSRSLTFGVLAAFIGGVYVGIVVGVGAMFDQSDGSNVGLSIAATAVVALVFQPVRGRVERWANRAVYGERATPYEVLAQFSRRSAEVPDDELLARIPHLIVDGTGASRAALWVRSEDGFSTASSWPETEAIGTLPGHDVFTDPDADYSVSVFHDGELLGGISLVKARGETIAPTEEELLANLAGGMGLALRNTQLTARLRQQVLDLTRSRDRIVSAADQARRSLEHDLDSGPQQQLVAVKVKLGPTRVLAEKAGAEKTAKILADIEAQAGEAIQAIRDFAGGIYPPLLEAEGLGVALGQQTRRAALPILVHADQIGRYPREVEAAVYFTVLEALQNTAKYADASSAEVTLTDQNGAVLFEVRDDGRGFDPDAAKAGAGLNGIDDRMDSVGGLWRIESKPGSGTILSGSVPVNEKANA